MRTKSSKPLIMPEQTDLSVAESLKPMAQLENLDNEELIEEPELMEAQEPKKLFVRKYLNLVLIAFVIASGSLAFYFFEQYQGIKANPQKEAQKEVKDLVAAVSQLMVLPISEDPTVATVADPAKLKDQPFFANAKKGDKVLIFANAKKAILYSPETNKIIEVAPLSIGNNPSMTNVKIVSPSPTPKPTKKP